MSNKTYLLIFCTEGDPYDKGYNLQSCIKDVKENLTKYFDEVFIHTPRSLKELPGSEEFCNTWPEPLDQNPNANHVGYFDFKSFLIDQTLKIIPQDSILIYHDGNFKRNPQYWESDWYDMPAIARRLLDHNRTDIFVQWEQSDVKVSWHVKSHVLENFFTIEDERNAVANSPLLGAARIILRNTEFSKKFVEDYKFYCLKKDLVAKTPIGNKVYPEFKWSCGDQDVLNALIYRYVLDGKLPSNFPGIIFPYRVITFNHKMFTWKFEGPVEEWHSRPHPAGIQFHHNNQLVDYIRTIKKVT